MNALVIRVSVKSMERMIEYAREVGVAQTVIHSFEGKGTPECICLVVEDKSEEVPAGEQ